jgi:hypothetical protein
MVTLTISPFVGYRGPLANTCPFNAMSALDKIVWLAVRLVKLVTGGGGGVMSDELTADHEEPNAFAA